MLTGLTGIFVWNFQPLLKLSSAPIFMYGVIHFINQILRAAGGLNAEKIVNKFETFQLILIEYIAVIISFTFLLLGYLIKNNLFIFIGLIMICIAILLFVVFGIFNVSKIHINVPDYNRATCASVNTFVEDFASFFLLLSFKIAYDHFGIISSICAFALISAIVLYPKFYKKSIDSTSNL